MNGDFSNASFTDLVQLLITVDGAGKETKRKALEELLERKFCEGLIQGQQENSENS